MESLNETLKPRRFNRPGPLAILVMLLVSMVGVTTTAQAGHSDRKTINVSKSISAPYLYCQRSRGDGDLCSRSWWSSHKTIGYRLRPHTFIDGDKVKVRVSYTSYENGGDYTMFTSTQTYTVYTAPAGWRPVWVRGPRFRMYFKKKGAHAGRSFRLPWSKANQIKCYYARIWGDTHGSDYRGQGYSLRFPLKVVLKKSS